MPDPQLQIQVPDDMQGGVYANIVGVWHSPFDFTLDFLVSLPATTDDDGNPVIPARVCSRVKLPPAVVFELMKAMNTELTNYEANYGSIKQPGQNADPDAPEVP